MRLLAEALAGAELDRAALDAAAGSTSTDLVLF
jgi:hypothetical protein